MALSRGMASGTAAPIFCRAAAAMASLLMMEAAVISRVPPAYDSVERHKYSEGPEWHLAHEAAIGRAAKIVDEISMPRPELEALLSAVQAAAAASGGAILVTTFDKGMVDLAQNMLTSLDRASSQVHRVVVGIGPGVCESLGRFEMTTCVPVFSGSASRGEAEWGSPEYWEVVFRKHVILSAVAASNVTNDIVYSDPDVVFMKSPVSPLKLGMGDDTDILFTPNNMLERNASSLEDLAEQYEMRGLGSITLGPLQRHPDINSGLFYMRVSAAVLELFQRATECLRKQRVGHYQQFCLTLALSELDGVQVRVAGGSEFANGNVFWGHRYLLHRRDVVSIHANWMQTEQKRRCLQAANLWFLGGSPPSVPKSMMLGNSSERVVMDKRFATVKECYTE